MEYFIGAGISFLLIFLLGQIVQRYQKKEFFLKPKISQSYLYQFMASYVEKNSQNVLETQSSDFLNKKYVKVVVLEDKAYWIQNNQLYVAEYHDGQVDSLSARGVDTFSMNSTELERTKNIVDKLAEGKDENSHSGD